MTALALVVDAVAAYRLTKLATDDVITQPAREAAIHHAYARAGRYVTACQLQEALSIGVDDPDRWQATALYDPDPPKLATPLTCRWCAGVWVAAGVTVARLAAPRVWDPIARGLTAAAAAALIANLED